MIVTSRSGVSPGPEEVGGKAASLFRLLRLGQRVPEFLVIPAAAHVAHPDDRLSGALQEEIVGAWRDLGGEAHAWAVRSSSLAEDSAEHSFAGVFTTILDVRGRDDLLAAVEACWASHASQEAVAYRDIREVGSDQAMAVVVQRMIDADWAGVCFTADPTTQALSVTVVEAVQGTGEKLVSGSVNSELVRVETESGKVLERNAPDGPRLPDALLEDVVKVSSAVAEAYGFPQDLEWAADSDGLWLLQSRPITTVTAVFLNRTLEPWDGAGRPDAPERVWSRTYADEIWTPPVSPLFYDVQHIAGVVTDYLARSGDDGPTPHDVFKYYRAAAYCDVDLLQRMYACVPPVARRPGIYNLLPPERREALRDAPWSWRMILRRLWLFEIKNGPRWGVARNHRFLAGAWPGFTRGSAELLAVDIGALDDAGLEAHTAAIWTLAGSIGLECGVAVLYYAHDLKLLLSGLLERWCGGDGETLYGGVSEGLGGSETVREADLIWNIAHEIGNSGQAELASSCSWCEFSSQAQARQTVIDSFQRLLSSHGHRGANYKDVIYPRWGDDPELLWGQVVAFLAGAPQPSSINLASAARRAKAQDAILRSCRGPASFVRREILKFLFKYNEIYVGLRDNHRFYYDQIWWLLRRTFVEKGKRLCAAGLLDDPDDVFLLNRAEHDQLRSGRLSPAGARERIAVRRREWTQTKREEPPRFLRRGYVPDEAYAAPPRAGELRGIAASPGQARGVARVIYDVAELGRVQRGDVLVARQTDPSWTPAFARASALVLETGSVLAHGASLCREFGLPCVTAVERASEHIKDGDLVEVSGSTGVVHILNQAPSTGGFQPARVAG